MIVHEEYSRNGLLKLRNSSRQIPNPGQINPLLLHDVDGQVDLPITLRGAEFKQPIKGIIGLFNIETTVHDQLEKFLCILFFNVLLQGRQQPCLLQGLLQFGDNLGCDLGEASQGSRDYLCQHYQNNLIVINIIVKVHSKANQQQKTLMQHQRKLQKMQKQTPQKPELSMHSEGQPQLEHQSTQRLFSFNQSFTNIEQNNKLIQQKTNSITKIKNLEDEIRSFKTRSNLWEKTKVEIMVLNKHLKLSSLLLNCSDSAIMKQFFQTVADLLEKKDQQTQHQKTQINQAKKKEQELFEKLVETNKRKYEAEQKLVQYQHQIQKLSEVNDSLREKSRVQSTQRSSKIKQFHQETILTIHHKQLEMGTLEERNDQLRRNLIAISQENELLKNELQEKEAQLSQKIDDNEELYLECEGLRKQLKAYQEEQNETISEMNEVKEYLSNIIEENISVREQLTKRAQLIESLKNIIEEARKANEDYISQQNLITNQQKSEKQAKLELLLQDEEQLKVSIKSNKRFGINQRRNSKRSTKNVSLKLLASSESLIS